MSAHGVVARAWKAMAEDRRLRVAELEAQVLEVRAERDEARHVAWLLWRDLRERELRGPSALRMARTYPWLNRSDGEALE